MRVKRRNTTTSKKNRNVEAISVGEMSIREKCNVASLS
jgi:hypothetical protein